MEDESNALKDENYGATVYVFQSSVVEQDLVSQIKEIQISNAGNSES